MGVKAAGYPHRWSIQASLCILAGKPACLSKAVNARRWRLPVFIFMSFIPLAASLTEIHNDNNF
jgi:hypothetical protein